MDSWNPRKADFSRPGKNKEIILFGITMTLEEAREEIDDANRKIVNDVRERMDAVLKVMDHKEREDIEIRDREREKEVKNQFEDLFEKKNLPEGRGEELAEVLIETAVDIQKDVMGR